jgi:hypothetical protein
VRRIPLGSFPPSRVNRELSRKYSTISSNSAFASSTPTTSAKLLSLGIGKEDTCVECEYENEYEFVWTKRVEGVQNKIVLCSAV